MRTGVCLVLSFAAAFAEDAPKARYGVDPDLKAFPQGTAKEALASMLKAAEAKQFEYLDAQLADPAFIDERVRRLHDGDFAEQVKDTRARLDPLTLKQLRRFLNDGEWTVRDDSATVRLSDLADKAVHFRKTEGRWYLEHRSQVK
jgi:hypothetical protein